MSRAIRNAFCLIGVSVIFLAGCSRSRESWSTERLANQITRTTHVVASDWFNGSMMVARGQEATNLIRAVSSARGLSKAESATTAPCCKIQFFCETNLLAKIVVQEEWFGTEDGGEYLDESDVLKSLQRRLKSDNSFRQAWVNDWAQDMLRNPELASIRDWSAGLLHRYETGGLKAGRYDDGPKGVAIADEEVPSGLKAPHVSIHKNPAGRPECVVFDWYNYGLVVVPTNQTTTFQAWYMTNLAPGIIAYHAGE